MKINRLLTNICSTDLAASKAFYTSLFGFSVAYDSDWFVQLTAPDTGLELGLIAEGHEIVPPGLPEKAAGGVYLTIVVDSVDKVYSKAQQLQLEVQQAPELMPYGQKRMLIASPEGIVIDVSSTESS